MCEGSILIIVDAAAGGDEVRAAVQRLRSRTDVPVIVMSGSIDPEHIAAHIDAILRGEGRAPRQLLDVGDIQIAPASRMVRVGGSAIDLTSIEYDLLEYLARDAGRVVSRDQLMAAVCRRDASPLDRSLDVHISHLRRKLRQHGSQIRTVRGVGYMLAAA